MQFYGLCRLADHFHRTFVLFCLPSTALLLSHDGLKYGSIFAPNNTLRAVPFENNTTSYKSVFITFMNVHLITHIRISGAHTVRLAVWIEMESCSDILIPVSPSLPTSLPHNWTAKLFFSEQVAFFNPRRQHAFLIRKHKYYIILAITATTVVLTGRKKWHIFCETK